MTEDVDMCLKCELHTWDVSGPGCTRWKVGSGGGHGDADLRPALVIPALKNPHPRQRLELTLDSSLNIHRLLKQNYRTCLKNALVHHGFALRGFWTNYSEQLLGFRVRNVTCSRGFRRFTVQHAEVDD